MSTPLKSAKCLIRTREKAAHGCLKRLGSSLSGSVSRCFTAPEPAGASKLATTATPLLPNGGRPCDPRYRLLLPDSDSNNLIWRIVLGDLVQVPAFVKPEQTQKTIGVPGRPISGLGRPEYPIIGRRILQSYDPLVLINISAGHQQMVEMIP